MLFHSRSSTGCAMSCANCPWLTAEGCSAPRCVGTPIEERITGAEDREDRVLQNRMTRRADRQLRKVFAKDHG